MEQNLDFFVDGLRTFGVEITEVQLQQFLKYYELLIEKNKVMNLTGITEFGEVFLKHFVDSISLVKAVDLNKQIRCIDIGTGAGFPGIPLKIMFPELEVVLLDSLNKRVKFLREVIEELELNNIEAIHGRAEDFASNKEYRETFDLCVSRAVANLSTLSEYCLPFVKIGGEFISYKSGEIEEELSGSKKAIHLLGGKISNQIKFELPNSDISRTFVVIEKISGTAKKYPRKAGLPSKEPI